MLASRKGHLKVVKTLLERGAELNHQNVVRHCIMYTEFTASGWLLFNIV